MANSLKVNKNEFDTRQALLESSKVLFTEKGYSAVSTREIAERASVNLGAIKYHFGSKAQLFVETVRQLMTERSEGVKFFSPPEDITTPAQAATELCGFVHAFIQDICHPCGPDVCRLMHREINGAASQDPEMFEPLVTSVAEEFIRPLDDRLIELIMMIKPAVSEQEAWLTAHSVIGQCAFYHTHRPFVNRLRDADLASEEYLKPICRFISEFTLRGLGLDEGQVNAALSELGKRSANA